MKDCFAFLDGDLIDLDRFARASGNQRFAARSKLGTVYLEKAPGFAHFRRKPMFAAFIIAKSQDARRRRGIRIGARLVWDQVAVPSDRVGR